jgi:hypothetical protein
LFAGDKLLLQVPFPYSAATTGKEKEKIEYIFANRIKMLIMPTADYLLVLTFGTTVEGLAGEFTLLIIWYQIGYIYFGSNWILMSLGVLVRVTFIMTITNLT